MGSLTSYQLLKSDNLQLSINGASGASLRIDAKSAEMFVHNMSVAHLSGSVTALNANVEGGSELVASKKDGVYQFVSDNVTGFVGNGSTMCVHCDGTISCNVSGNSRVFYSGSADISQSFVDEVSQITQE